MGEETPRIRLLSVQVGVPRSHGTKGAADPMDRPWRTAFFKEPVEGPVRLGRLGLEGDGQADPRYHGGPEKAVLAYAASHYPLWLAELGIEMPHGGFGENFTVAGQDERTVCLGDVYAVGEARVQVSQPRGPCWKIARRWRRKDLAARVQENGRTGWYLRVLREGTVEAGVEMEMLERAHPEWSVARVNAILFAKPLDPAALLELAGCEALTPGKRRSLRQKAEALAEEDDQLRLFGADGE